jgi:ATP-dependent Clp protease protease subunit
MEVPMQVIVPNNVENLQLPSPELLTYYRNLEDRVIWIDYGVDESILEVSKQIMYFNKEDKDVPVEQRKPIKLLIYSYGGDGQACFSLLDVIALSKTPIYTVNMGVAMSAGLLILLAGHKRFCLKNSTALAHSGSGGASGTFEQTEAQMKDYKRFVDTMRNYIIERTDIDTKTLNKYKSKEWYLYAEEQTKYRVVDKVIDNIDEIL